MCWGSRHCYHWGGDVTRSRQKYKVQSRTAHWLLIQLSRVRVPKIGPCIGGEVGLDESNTRHPICSLPCQSHNAKKRIANELHFTDYQSPFSLHPGHEHVSRVLKLARLGDSLRPSFHPLCFVFVTAFVQIHSSSEGTSPIFPERLGRAHRYTI